MVQKFASTLDVRSLKSGRSRFFFGPSYPFSRLGHPRIFVLFLAKLKRDATALIDSTDSYFVCGVMTKIKSKTPCRLFVPAQSFQSLLHIACKFGCPRF